MSLIQRAQQSGIQPQGGMQQYTPPTKPKGFLERAADVISAPVEFLSSFTTKPIVETFARPVGEVVASSYELAGQQAPQWAKQNRLSSPELLGLEQSVAKYGLGATNEQTRQQIEQSRAAGNRGAGFTDVLNVASLLPGGILAKGAGTVARGGRVAAGAEKFIPALKTTLKEAVPAGAGWGGAYGAAGAADEGASAMDIAKGAGVGALTGAALGLGLGTATAGLGAAAKKVGQLTNKEMGERAAVARNLDALTQLENANAPLRKLTQKYEGQGIDVKTMLAQSDFLKGSVDSNGVIRTTKDGGAVSQMQDFLAPRENVVRDLLVREGNSVPLTKIEQRLRRNIDKSGLEGAALDAAHTKLDSEMRGLARRADEYGNIPLSTVQDAKVNKYATIDYLNPSSKAADKEIARTFKEVIEDFTESVDVKNVNKELQKYFALLSFLERLDGKKVQGGRLGKYFAQTVGSIVGSHFGPLGSIAGAELGGRIRGAGMASTFNKATGQGLQVSDLLTEATALSKTPRPLVPESRRLPAPSEANRPIIPLRGPTQIEAQAPIIGGVGQKPGTYSMSLGKRNTTQRSASTPTRKPIISKTVPQNGAEIVNKLKKQNKIDVNSVESLSSEITRRVEKFRKEAGLVAQREGAGVRLRNVEDGAGNINFVTKDFSLSRAKGQMKHQADSAKKYAQTMLYENDPEFRSMVDMRDALLETKIVEAKTVSEVDDIFRVAEKEEQTILNEVKQYESAAIDETPDTPTQNQGNGIGQEEAPNEVALLSEAKKYKTAEEFVRAHGEPLYHGTNADFEVFDKNKIGSATDPGLFGRGFYFGNTESFARIAPAGRLAKNVMEVYPLSRNLFDISKVKSKGEMAELLGMSEHALTQDSNGIIRPKMDQIGQFTSHVEGLGYDGVIVKRGGDAIETVIFDSKNLKTKSQLLDIYKKAHKK